MPSKEDYVEPSLMLKKMCEQLSRSDYPSNEREDYEVWSAAGKSGSLGWIRNKVAALPTREEFIGGQRHQYLSRDEVLSLLPEPPKGGGQ